MKIESQNISYSFWIHFIRHSKTYEKLNQQNMKRSAAEDCHLIMIVSNRVSQKSDLQNAAGTQKSQPKLSAVGPSFCMSMTLEYVISLSLRMNQAKIFLINFGFILHVIPKPMMKLNQHNMKRSAAEYCHLIMIVSYRVSQKM